MNDLLRFHTAWVEGESYHHSIEDAQIPAMVDQTEGFRGGGMDGEIDVELGQEKPTASFMLSSFDPKVMKRAGLVAGKRTRITFRGHTVSEFTEDEKEVLAIVEGRISATPKPWKAGSKAGVEFPIGSITYHKLTVNGALVWERDIPNMIRRIGEVDQLASARQSLGF